MKGQTAAAPARQNVPYRICVFLKETFPTLRFAEGALLCCGIYVLGDLVWWGAKSFLYVFGASTLFSSFIYLFPVCAAFPTPPRYRENRKNHLDYMIFAAVLGFQVFEHPEFVRTAVSGFAVMAVGTLLFLGLIPVCFPHAVLSYELEEIGGLIMPFLETVAQAENWFAYLDFIRCSSGFPALLGRSGPDRLRMGGQHVCDLHFPILFFVRDGHAAPTFTCIRFQGNCFAMYYYETWQQAPLLSAGDLPGR